MKSSSILDALKSRQEPNVDVLRDEAIRRMTPPKVKKVSDRTIDYSYRHRGSWFRPEYDFDEISIAQDVDSYLLRAILKKVNRIVVAGYGFVGKDKSAVDYIEYRFAHMEMATNQPMSIKIFSTFFDLFRYNNCMWVKKRGSDISPGNVRKDITGVELEPVAGYFILPFETLEFKSKRNGEIKKVKQLMPNGDRKEFAPKDIIHFYTNKKPGFTVGTPEMMPALEDIQLLRRIEENVEDLIEANLFPVFHFKIGNDKFPERFAPDGTKETDIVKKTVEYMPPGGVYVSDHRQEITAIGSEGRALRIDVYLNHFKSRVFTSLGVSAIDMGEGADANRSTASTLSKGMLLDIESVAIQVEEFINFYVINELLLEGGFNPMDKNQAVKIQFGVIDKEDRRADENHDIQLFHGNAISIDELRKRLSIEPYSDEHFERSFYKMFEEPSQLLRAASPGSAAVEALAQNERSSITPANVSKEKQFNKQQQQTKGVKSGRPTEKANGGQRASAARNRPSNQTGTRATAKTTNDISIVDENGIIYTVACDKEIDAATIEAWKKMVTRRYNLVKDFGVAFSTVVENLQWRLKD